ncbi:MAG TPA: aldehyde ferredoxin oxidoreductase family protein [Syntrophorhabdaceae bacterium]|nr:aldehyde ferredoxin oxidoreductase family protein [Syntrophorhabdaceae bacterium]
MVKGDRGKVVRVDLSTQAITYDYVDEVTARKYVGGSGLAAKILWDETTPNTHPLSPENLLMFMTGPLTGTIVPSSSRYVVAGISPLTGIWGKATVGGKLAYELRHGGFDGIVVKGKAQKPVYLWFHDGEATIRDSAHIWGRDVYEAAELLRGETDKNAGIACIGPAGEKQVKIACIIGDGKAGRAGARCGLGALMGAKNLKAIVARGTFPVHVKSRERLQRSVRKLYAIYPPRHEDKTIVREAQAILKSIVPVGGFPVKNWTEGTFGEELCRMADDTERAKPIFCKGCPYGCGESLYTPDGERHVVWEAWGPLGTNCLIDNMETLQEAYSFCNKYGLDSISTGGVIAFAMECFDKGLITKKDTDGIDLHWGNHEAMLEMVKQIGRREGFGELLGDGVRIAAERIGGCAAEYAIHTKGLEYPAHDPRAAMGGALAYATGSIGACHIEAAGIKGIENYSGGTTDRSYPDFGYSETLNRFALEGKAELAAKTQDWGTMLDSLVICYFVSSRLQPSDVINLLNSVTGWDMDLKEFMCAGERAFNLFRMINVRRGISRKDDTLPPRFLSHKRGTGGAADSLPFLGSMLNEYYLYRGWSEEGVPTRKTLTRLGLEQCPVPRPRKK